jgi:hypothetical protein
MTATREHRNAGKIEDAVAVVGGSITVTEHLAHVIWLHLPDDFAPGFHQAMAELRAAHERVQEVLGV